MIDPWFVRSLVCPIDKKTLRMAGGDLVCAAGHRYPVVDDVPVMLLAGEPQTIELANASLRRATTADHDARAPELYLESVGISEVEKAELLELAGNGSTVDPVVAFLVAATNGLMYRHLIGALDRYPIPELPLPQSDGRRLLDVGCSWGRWTLAAAARGYDAVGIDPSLGAVMAARRVAVQLGAPARYIVGDARHLPFPDEAFDAVYSYSVIQHFAPADASQAVAEMGRVLRAGGVAKVQMPTRFGIRCLYHQARRGFRAARQFEVRYRTLPQLRQLFERGVGRARFQADGYFGIGLQASDAPLMNAAMKTVIRASETIKRASRHVPALTWCADSVFVEATKR